MGFRSLPAGFKVRERADPKGAEGGGGPKKPATRLCVRPRRLPAARSGGSRGSRTHGPSDRARCPAAVSGPNRPPTQAVESDRAWKAPGPPTTHPRTFPHPLEIPAPKPTTRDSHRYTQPRRGGDRHWTTTSRAAQSIPCCHTHAVRDDMAPVRSAHRRAERSMSALLTTRPVTAPKLRPLPATRPPGPPSSGAVPIPRPSQNHLISTAAS